MSVVRLDVAIYAFPDSICRQHGLTIRPWAAGITAELQPRVFDCILLGTASVEILELHLLELNDVVDRFVASPHLSCAHIWARCHHR